MDKLDIAIERVKTAAEMSEHFYKLPLIVTYSGGKDSVAVLEVAKASGVKFEVLNSHTTADAPQTVLHIRNKFHELELQGIKCTIEYPFYKGKRTSMWDLIIQKGMPPTRRVRYCCEVLKENSGNNRSILTGVRWDESTARKNNRGIYEDINRNRDKRIILTNDNDDRRRLFERCEMKAKTVCNPIIDWTTQEVYDFNASQNVCLNPLYGCGFDRIGCIGCPMAGKKRYRDFKMFPKYKNMYINAFDKMLEKRATDGKAKNMDWQSGKEVFKWWMGENHMQTQMFEDE